MSPRRMVDPGCEAGVGGAQRPRPTNGQGELAHGQPVVAVGRGAPEQLSEVLDDVLERVGLWPRLESLARGRGPRAMTVVIKVDLGPEGLLGPTRRRAVATDPTAVEHLIGRLHERGYSDTRVLVAGDNGLGRADELGYAFVSPQGDEYDIVEVKEALRDDAFAADSPLGGAAVSQAWAEADVRIVFAKNTTCGLDFYALCLSSLGEVLDDRRAEPLEPEDVPAELMLALPPHFALIDAWHSSAGRDGRAQPAPLATHTLLASDDALLCDWAGAFKLGVDPYSSRINARALETSGAPANYRTDGDLAPYENIERPDPLYVHARRLGGDGLALADRVHGALFWRGRKGSTEPDGIDGIDAPQLADALAHVSRVWAGLGMGALRRGVEAYRVLGDKDALPRRAGSLGLDPHAMPLSEYEAAAPYLQHLETLVSQAPADGAGLSWCYLDGSVLFKYERTIAVPFEDFVARVEVSRSVQMMNDYLGGASVPVRRDERGRVTHQATRTIYLPQPNFQVLFGGKPIDVSKLEYSRYGEREHQVCWRTVKSLNDSATHDDGAVRLRDAGRDGTTVTIVARQKFALPLFWQAVQIDLHDAFKRAVIEYAYRDYFARTLANFEAAYEGRAFRTGREPGAQEAGKNPLAGARERAQRWVGRDGRLGRALRGALGVQSRRPREIDSDGFAHFEAPGARASNGHHASRPAGLAREAQDLMADLAHALRKDWPGLPPEPLAPASRRKPR